MAYRILTFDGGGVRGVISATILQRLERSFPGFLDHVDLFAGTSTGGLIALCLASGLPVEAVLDLYRNSSREIFDDSWLDDVVDLGSWTGADYDNAHLHRRVSAIFGNLKLRDVPKQVLVPAFDLDDASAQPRRWKPKLFHNFPIPGNDGDQLVTDVVLATTAAPTYFPSWKGYIDGGVYANNPSLCALAQSQFHGWEGRPPLSDVALLSVGTGTPQRHIRGDRLDWGKLQWAENVVELMMDGVAGVADYQCRQLLAERYHRVQMYLENAYNFALDDVDRVEDMIAFANEVDLRAIEEWVQKTWRH